MVVWGTDRMTESPSLGNCERERAIIADRGRLVFPQNLTRTRITADESYQTDMLQHCDYCTLNRAEKELHD